MRIISAFLAFAMCACSAFASAPVALSGIIARLSAADNYAALAHYQVLQGNSESPICYDVKLMSGAPDSTDSLCPANYLIDWSMKRGSSPLCGFYAYFHGNHYRYRNNRLNEFHFTEDSVPFVLGELPFRGVQCQAQFSELLPQFVAKRMLSMLSDSTYNIYVCPDTVINGCKVTTVKGSRAFQGATSLEFLYVFDKTNAMPVSLEQTTNPDMVGEQFLTVSYEQPMLNQGVMPVSEGQLCELYPAAFAKHRQKTMRAENLVGEFLPQFSAPTLTGERYFYAKNSGFANPTLLAVIHDNSNAQEMKATVDALRNSVAKLPHTPNLIFAFVGNNADQIETATGPCGLGEFILIGARGLARDCGVKNANAIIVCDTSGRVRNVFTGFNKDIEQFVIKSINR